MNRTRFLVCGLISLVITSCTTNLETEQNRNRPPPSFEVMKKRYDAVGVCDASVDIPASARKEEDWPQSLVYCHPVYPAELQRAIYEAECLTRFDLTEDGVPIIREVNCRVWGQQDEFVKEWDIYAKNMFEFLVNEATKQNRYKSLEDAPGSAREHFYQPYRFYLQ